jgi:hypothetical protein
MAAVSTAHHSAAAEYVAELSTWNGMVTRFSWMNPHTWIYFDTTDAKGSLIHYECEGGSPNGSISNGWSKTTLKPGDKVTIEGWRAKDRPEGCKVRAVILPDHRKLFMGYIAE